MSLCFTSALLASSFQHSSPRDFAPALFPLSLRFRILLVFVFNRFNLGHGGWALASSLSAYLQAFLLFWKLKNIQGYQLRKKWRGFILKIILAMIFMAGIIVYGVPDVSIWFDWSAL